MRWLAVLLLPVVVLAATYYVAKTGDDEDDGSAETPWLTIAHATSTLIAGDTCWVKEGTYAEDSVDFGTHAGTAADPIVLISYDDWSTIIDCLIYFNEKHCELNGFRCVFHNTGVLSAEIKFYADSCAVRNCEVQPDEDNAYQGIGILTGSGLNGIVIDSNTVHGFGTGTTHQGIYASGTHITITHNVCYEIDGYGIQAYPEIESSEVAYNLCYGSIERSGILLDGYYNTVHHNVCYGNASCGVLLSSDAGHGNEVYNNTCYNNGFAGFYVEHVGTNSLSNNISLSNGLCELYVDSMTSLTTDYNNFYPDAATAFHWGTGAQNGNYAEYKAATGQETHGLCQNPFLSDIAEHDFTLSDTSPCIEAGDPATTPSYDIAGIYKSDSFDLGAYWYYGGGSAPEPLRVIPALMRW
jgi:parallel beta-helix repeat protein